ncbi:UBX domain containing protein [Trichuris trichiura]|uniref:UBX domain containing protein n=1 Tax=Trichuris trichiura TaxID=36087 RepID=A0A077Z3M1_TRITR|nr:UBX domain containing protein [Trichuris trichiura]
METQMEKTLEVERQTEKEEQLNQPNETLIEADTSSKLSGISDVTESEEELEQSVYDVESERSVQNVGGYCSNDERAVESAGHLNLNCCIDRNVAIFRAENDGLEEPDDGFYTVTISDAFAIQKRLQETLKRLSNPPLVSQRKLRELELDRKRMSWKVTIIKVKLPQQWVLQAAFLSDEPVKNVYDFVRSCLANPNAAFTLLLLPAQIIAPSEEGLIDAEMPIEDVLKPELLKLATSSSVAQTRARQRYTKNYTGEDW